QAWWMADTLPGQLAGGSLTAWLRLQVEPRGERTKGRMRSGGKYRPAPGRLSDPAAGRSAQHLPRNGTVKVPAKCAARRSATHPQAPAAGTRSVESSTERDASSTRAAGRARPTGPALPTPP